jgi:DNA repair exonuclease SbcCD nuclease subunit
MKFLFFTDSHIKSTPPENRKDNYHQSLINKLNEIVSISKNEKVDYILHGGDWYDRPSNDKSLSSEVTAILKTFDKPVYTIYGNHDIFGASPLTVEGTMLGALINERIVHLITNDEKIFLREDALTVQLTGKSNKYGMDSVQNRDYYYIVKKDRKADYAINMVHGMLLYKPFPPGIPFTLLNEISQTGADITLSGHYHSGYGIINLNNRYFINPGSIVRITNYQSELYRIPQVIIIDIKESISIKQIELKSVLPGHDVLDEQKLNFD